VAGVRRRWPAQVGQQPGEAGVLGAVVDHQQGQALAAAAAPPVGAAPQLHRDPGPQHPARHRQPGGRLAGPRGGQPRRWPVAGELDHRFLPERPLRPQRVGRVGDQHRPGVAEAELQLVLHPVHGGPWELQLPAAGRPGTGERRADPGSLHLLVQPHLPHGPFGVCHAEGHPGGPDDRAGPGRRGAGHPRRIAGPVDTAPSAFGRVEMPRARSPIPKVIVCSSMSCRWRPPRSRSS
jgi:hypothetical protein